MKLEAVLKHVQYLHRKLIMSIELPPLQNHRHHRVGGVEGADRSADGAVDVVQRVDLALPE